MSSAKYLGYLSGAAVAAGVGAAIAVSGQGTAHADADGPSSSSASESSASESSAKESAKAEKAETKTAEKAEKAEKESVDAGPSRTEDKPKFDPAKAVEELTKKFGITKPVAEEEPEDEVVETEEPVDAEEPVEPEEPVDAEEPVEAVVPAPILQPVSKLADRAAEAVAALAPVVKIAPESAAAEAKVAAAAGPVPWSPNPFRPMPPEPAPNDMPGLLWDIEQQVVGAFEQVPFLQPFVREGYEAVFRVSQMIPWVNVVIPVINIAGQVPNLTSGDPELFRDATQRIVNNLLVTIHPVSVVYYAYDEVADLINVEYEAQQFKEVFYSTAWNLLDPFALLHNRGESGLPMSPSSPTQEVPAETTVKLAASVDVQAAIDEPGSDPFRAEDPDPIGMPAPLLQTRDLISLLLPPELKPVFREAFEAAYRASQVVPVANIALNAGAILPAAFQALTGDRSGAQIAINQLLLTTGVVAAAYYGYDQIVDLLNMEEAGFAAKEQFYIDTWDQVDPNGWLHVPGQSGLSAG